MAASMDSSSEEASEISDSEIDDYEAKSYLKLKSGKHKIKIANGTYRCPFCLGKKKQDYCYKDLLQHATGIGSSNRKGKVKANHRAFAKYLATDLADEAAPPLQLMAIEKESPSKPKQDDQFVYPWMGIIVNLPTELKDGQYVRKTGTGMRKHLSKFNPLKVHPLWNFEGHGGSAIVDFIKDWTGFQDAMAFENYFETKSCGKKDWYERQHRGSDMYGWLARAEDYNTMSAVGEHLRKNGDLKTVTDLTEEEYRKNQTLVAYLANQIEVKNKHLQKLECKYNENATSLDRMTKERDKLHQAYNEGIQKMQHVECDYHRWISGGNEKLSLQLDSKRKELDLQFRQLDELVSQNDMDGELVEENKKDAKKSCSLRMVSMKLKTAVEEVLKLVEKQKEVMKEADKKLVELNTELGDEAAYQAVTASLMEMSIGTVADS